MNIQIVSDIHAEFWDSKDKFNFIKPSAPVLALLGDICCCGSEDDFNTFKRFINEILPYYEQIIFVSGNHEYYFNPSKKITPAYANTIQGIDDRIRSFFVATSPKLYYLNNSSISIATKKNKYLIIGATLWSWTPEEYRKKIQESMNDYKYVYISELNKIRLINANDIAALHLKSYKYIKTQINKAKKIGQQVIVLTHHKPYLSPTYDASTLDSAYESDLSSLFDAPVVLWGYGHTHVADNSMQGATWLYSNPKGYPKQKTKYNKAAVLKI
jgi:predicted phosphodiesterase